MRRRFVLIDVETTGLLPPVLSLKRVRVIEIGALAVEDGAIVGKLSQLIHPGEAISSEITKITGITNADLIGKPSFREFAPALNRFLRSADILVAHNAAFDVGVIQREDAVIELPDTIICSVQEYQYEYGKRQKLSDFYEHTTGWPLQQTHRALDDCEALHQALNAIGFYDEV